ncbi:MAG: amidohydrolase [Anaerolineaceae bacterium]|nr:amidohydrolase [Anaerolineaceae bacterium]
MQHLRNDYDILITDANILTMDPQRRIIKEGVLGIRGEKIAFVGSKAEFEPSASSAETLAMPGKLLMPGLINTHGHIAMALFRGFSDDLALEAWLAKIWKVEAQTVTPENIQAGVELALAEMLRGGTTAAADMYFQYATVCRTCSTIGFRLFNGPSFAVIPGFEARKNVYYEAALEMLDIFKDDPLIHPCVQAHSTYTASLQMLEEIARIKEERGLVFVTHAAESLGEMKQVRSLYNKTPIEVLNEAGLLSRKTLLAHGVHLSEAEMDLLAERGSSVAHCPQSNLKLSSGIARIAEMIGRGVNVSLGTDGCASNNDLDLFHEAQTAALLQKGITMDPSVLAAEEAVAMLTINGARAFGLEDKIGSLEAGKLADIAVLDFNTANMTPCYDLYSHIIYAASAHNVCHTMVNGRWLMKDRQLFSVDEEAAKAKVNKIALEVGRLAA